MEEAFLHYIWQFQYFDHEALQTASGEKITIFNPGTRNVDAGPDFFNARIKIGTIEWVGNVEIHIQSSGWNAHKHNTDPAYENVILHVVWKNDAIIKRQDSSTVATLELQNKVKENLVLQYKTLLYNPATIPCSSSVTNVQELTRLSMLDKALMYRLENKSTIILKTLQRNNNDWEETSYQMLCRNFGFKVNAEPFQQLSQHLPYKVLMKHSDKLVQLEALLFGQAGFLDDKNNVDDYYQLLKREHGLLSQKFSLQANKLNKTQWKFLRLRPANFPTMRIAQLASLLFKQKNIFSKFIEASTYKELVSILTAEQTDYWKRHYQFAKPVEEEIPALGKMSIDTIIINTVVPLTVAYGKFKDEQSLVDKAVQFLHEISAEKNTVIKTWNSLGVSCTTAFDSQALLELYNNFCLRRRCLDCVIGASLVRPATL
jgi:hypothetical protein